MPAICAKVPERCGSISGRGASGSRSISASAARDDCIVDKIEEFGAELRSPRTDPRERLLALQFLLHFVGDLHQPLHAAVLNQALE